VVVVTGASAGVGRATVRAFARQGARIGLLARGKDGLEAARREVEEAGGEALVIQTDVAHAGQVEAAAERIEEHFGPIDVWINNAVATIFAPVKETTPTDYRRVTEVTYLGVVHGTLAALKRMLPRNRGMILQVSGARALRSVPLQSAYSGAKLAVEGFTESLRYELLHDRSGVRVAIVHLPTMNTPQFGWAKSRLPRTPQPIPPVFQPEVAAEAIVWAATHGRPRDVDVSGPSVRSVLGTRVLAPIVERYVARVGYAKQQSNGVDHHQRPNDLWAPVAGDHGAHGPFDAQARRFSLRAWSTMHRGWALLGAACVAGLLTAAIAGRKAL
jgi:NAD(P)-dependent dehydrogenase (short-subunit alcohol dehydrogenase family)